MNMIFSCDRAGGIGIGNRLLYSIPSDLARFKELTIGNTVVMGRATFLSLPGAKPLADRTNIVLSTDPDFSPDGVIVCRSTDELLELCKSIDTEIFVIGGEIVFRQLEPYCTKAYVTLISGSSEADRHFTLGSQWTLTDISDTYIYNSIEYRFAQFERTTI